MTQTKSQLVSPVGILTASGVSVTGVVTASSFVGNLTGTATGVTGTPNLNVGVITASNFVGNLTGNVTGNVTGNLTGTASTATAAATAYGLTGSPNITVNTLTATQISAGGTTGTTNNVLKSTGSGLEWGTAGGDDFIATDLETNLPSSDYYHWVTTDLIIIRSSDNVYVINKSTKQVVNTYTYSGLVGFEVFNDTLAVGCTNSVVFKVSISGNTLTRGTDSSAFPSNHPGGTWINGTIKGLCVLSTSQVAIVAEYYSSGSNTNAISLAAVNISSTPSIGTPTTPESIGNGNGLYFKSAKRINNNQAFFITTGSGAANNYFRLVYASGTSISSADIRVVFNNDGYGFGRSFNLPGTRGYGIPSTIYQGPNGNWFYVFSTGENSANVGCISVTPGGTTFTESTLQLANFSTNGFNKDLPWTIYPGANSTHILIILNTRESSGSASRQRYYYVENSSGTSLTLRTSGSLGELFTYTEVHTPKVFTDSVNGNLGLLTTLLNNNYSVLQWENRYYTIVGSTSGSTFTITNNTPSLPQFTTIQQTEKEPLISEANAGGLLVSGSTYYHISSKYVLKSTDAFTSGTISISSPSKYLRWRGENSLRSLYNNVAVGIVGNSNRLYLVEVQ